MKLFYAKVLAEELMYIHGLFDWVFVFDNAKKRFGCCHYTKKTISLSAELVALNTEESVKNVILHEIAHALCGFAAGHSAVWKACVTKIGGVPTRCYGNEIVTPLLTFTASCSLCGLRIQRKTKKHLQCAKCKKTLIWKKNQQ